MYLYLRTKFQVSSIILRSSRQEVRVINFSPSLTSKRIAKMPTQIRLNVVKMYQFKAKSSEIEQNPLFLGNISKDFTLNNMKKTGLKEVVQLFSIDYDPINTGDILYVHRYLMK